MYSSLRENPSYEPVCPNSLVMVITQHFRGKSHTKKIFMKSIFLLNKNSNDFNSCLIHEYTTVIFRQI